MYESLRLLRGEARQGQVHHGVPVLARRELVPASREARHSPTSAPRAIDTARLAAAAAKRRRIVAVVRGSTRARESTGRFGTYTARLVNARGEASIRRNDVPGGGREGLLRRWVHGRAARNDGFVRETTRTAEKKRRCVSDRPAPLR